MRVHLIPMRKDNYTFLLESRSDSNSVWIIDPSDETIVAILKKLDLNVLGVLNTHHHYDHVGGNEAVVSEWGCSVYGAEADKGRVPCLTHRLKDGDTCDIGGWQMKVMETPGHTLGALCFVFEEAQKVFVGDTLFAMGCGRLFEGTPEQMLGSLLKIASLEESYEVYCGHEYTQSNGVFALSIEKHSHLVSRMLEVKSLLSKNQPTVPSSIGKEWKTNPFLRCCLPSKELSAESISRFTELRKAKDDF